MSSCLYGEDPLGEPYDCSVYGVMSLLALWFNVYASPITKTTLILGDIGMLANKIFITENIILEDIDLSGGPECSFFDYECYEYWVETMKVRNVNIQNNSNVIFEIDKEIEFEKNFEVELGSTIEVINK